MKYCCWVFAALLGWGLTLGPAASQDIDGVQEHPMVSRFPGQTIQWQEIQNHAEYRVAIGPVTGYRTIEYWIDTEGRITRTHYVYRGKDRAYSEFYLNYITALEAQDFEILGKGLHDFRRGTDVGTSQWQNVLYGENPTTKPGEVRTIFSGTSSQGGTGSIVARKERAAGTAYVVITVEQHADDYVGTLIDIIEVASAETGLVVVDAEAIGSDITEYGRVVLDGIVFDFDKATLKPESDAALSAIAEYLNANPDKLFYVVGHTDYVGSFDYNRDLSLARASAVVEALQSRFGIPRERLTPNGIGPLSPVFSNTSDAGRERNRRVELVERQPPQ